MCKLLVMHGTNSVKIVFLFECSHSALKAEQSAQESLSSKDDAPVTSQLKASISTGSFIQIPRHEVMDSDSRAEAL